MSKCKTHNIDYGWTCPVCEKELSFVGSSYEIQAFRDGYNNAPNMYQNVHLNSAYLKGKEYRGYYEESN